MNYLEQTLKINIRYQEWNGSGKLPYMITDRYDFRLTWLDRYEVLFVYVREELEQLAVLKKHLEQVWKVAGLPIVLIMNKIDARRKQQLIDNDIPFVVPGQQIYLPFLGAVLQERYAKEYTADDKLMPSSELLLLYYIDTCSNIIYMNEATKDLGFSAMTISRAVRQLEANHLICTHKDGVQKVITSDLNKKELFEKARNLLPSPVKKIVYIDKTDQAHSLPVAGLSALSEYSMLNPPSLKCYAAHRLPEWATGVSDSLLDSDHQLQLEIWNYDPQILARKKLVGMLPLVLSLKDSPDERIQIELDAALEEYWEVYDGKRI